MSITAFDHRARAIFAESHHVFREQVRRFYADEIEPQVAAWELAGGFPRDLFRKAAAAGILAPGFPTEYGGGGGDVLHFAVCYEEHGYSPVGAAIDSGIDTDASAYIIYLGGTEEQKQTWLPRFASGEVIGEGLFTEPHSGSDMASMTTTAVKDGDHYVINGSKAWITNASHLDLCLLVARVATTSGAPGFGLFLVDGNAAGVTKGKPFQTLVRGCGNLGEIFFDNVRIGEDRVLGGSVKGGIGHAARALNVTRVLYAARCLASCELALAMTLDFVKQRHAFGGRLFDLPTLQARLADISMEVTVTRPYIDQCLAKLRDGTISATESSMAKLWATELEVRVTDQCAHMHGAMGLSNEHPISRMVAAARAHRYAMGVSEMQRQTIIRNL
jgi:acyl-CoA dehydrogenase